MCLLKLHEVYPSLPKPFATPEGIEEPDLASIFSKQMLHNLPLANQNFEEDRGHRMKENFIEIVNESMLIEHKTQHKSIEKEGKVTKH